MRTGATRTAAVAALAVLLALRAAGAAEANCSPGDLTADDPLEAVVVADEAKRLPFIKNAEDQAGCPALTEACRTRAYLIPGNGVIAGPVLNGFRCATYLAASGQSRTGWLPAAGLIAQPAAGSADWTGRWTAGPEQTITIRRGGDGALRLEGEATYGASDPARVRRGAVNLGQFSASVRPEQIAAGPLIAFTEGEARTLAYDQGDEFACRVKLRLVGPWMVVSDNGNCGGHNVSFSGVYRQAR